MVPNPPFRFRTKLGSNSQQHLQGPCSWPVPVARLCPCAEVPSRAVGASGVGLGRGHTLGRVGVPTECFQAPGPHASFSTDSVIPCTKPQHSWPCCRNLTRFIPNETVDLECLFPMSQFPSSGQKCNLFTREILSVVFLMVTEHRGW